VDVVGKSKNARERDVYIEVELRRGSPVVNVAKIWKRVKGGTVRKNSILVHAFSGFYSTTDARRLNAEFIGKEMERATDVAYLAIPFKYKPRKGGKTGAGRRRLHAGELAKHIIRELKLT
jgi:hypothetical protein